MRDLIIKCLETNHGSLIQGHLNTWIKVIKRLVNIGMPDWTIRDVKEIGTVTLNA